MYGHRGCVNTAAWTPDGLSILTGSDDTRICLYSLPRARPRALPMGLFASGHTNNIFCVRSLSPTLNAGAVSLVSCAADGEVRLHTLRLEGGSRVLAASHVLSRHGSRAHRLAVPGSGAGAPLCTFASCGEDGAVRFYDTRVGTGPQCETASFSMQTRSGGRLRLFSLEYRPGCASQLAVGGSDGVARIWDSRYLSHAPYQYLPRHLQGTGPRSAAASMLTVTCTTFSLNGLRLAAALNDEDTHIFEVDGGAGGGGDLLPWGGEGGGEVRVFSGVGKDARRVKDVGPVAEGGGGGCAFENELPTRASVACSGHTNCQTIKGCSFFGSSSEYLLQGSDCGTVFLYSSKSGKCLAEWRDADVLGAVNVVAPHPDASLPLFLTSGLESTTKLWQPSDFDAQYGEEEEDREGEGGEEGEGEDGDESFYDNEEDDEEEEEESWEFSEE